MATKAEKNEKTFFEKLVEVQQELKAPKGQYNGFAHYKYRSAEDIIEAVKPLLHERGLLLIISDDVQLIGSRYYITATAKVTDGEKEVHTTASAREEEQKKGMDGSQITGTASSYARKYALNGLFAIDDTKDADALNTSKEYTQPMVTPETMNAQLMAAQTVNELLAAWNAHPEMQGIPEVAETMKRECQRFK